MSFYGRLTIGQLVAAARAAIVETWRDRAVAPSRATEHAHLRVIDGGGARTSSPWGSRPLLRVLP